MAKRKTQMTRMKMTTTMNRVHRYRRWPECHLSRAMLHPWLSQEFHLLLGDPGCLPVDIKVGEIKLSSLWLAAIIPITWVNALSPSLLQECLQWCQVFHPWCMECLPCTACLQGTISVLDFVLDRTFSHQMFCSAWKSLGKASYSTECLLQDDANGWDDASHDARHAWYATRLVDL